jgi:hypothetical protein
LTKFNKARLIPLHPSNVENLKQYLRRMISFIPDPPHHAFFSNKGMPLTDCIVKGTFIKISRFPRCFSPFLPTA